jgi:hypothetical protein
VLEFLFYFLLVLHASDKIFSLRNIMVKSVLRKQPKLLIRTNKWSDPVCFFKKPKANYPSVNLNFLRAWSELTDLNFRCSSKSTSLRHPPPPHPGPNRMLCVIVSQLKNVLQLFLSGGGWGRVVLRQFNKELVLP